MGRMAKRIVKWGGLTAGTVALLAGGLGAYLYTQKPKPIGQRPVLQAGLFTRQAHELPVERRFIYASARELAAMIRNRQATSRAIVQTHLNFIKNNNYKTNAFVWLFEEDAMAAAKAADEKIARAEPTGLLPVYYTACR